MCPAFKGVPAAVLAALACAAPAPAQSVPDPCPTPRRPPVEALIVPLLPCEASDVRLAFLHFCCTQVSLAQVSPRIRLDVTTWPDSCANVRCVPETLFVALGRFAAGNHAVTIDYRTEWVEGGSACVSATSETIEFVVRKDCPPPTGIYFLERVEIGRGDRQACPGDSIPVRLSGALPDNCTSLERIEVIPPFVLSSVLVPPRLRLVFEQPTCLGRPCIIAPVPWSATVKIPPLPPGAYMLPVEAIGLDPCPIPADTTALGANRFPFQVLEACEQAGCLWPGWKHPHPGARCDAFVGPDLEARLEFTLRADVALAALQGGFATDPPGLQVEAIEAVGPASGMQLSWNPTPGGARFVLFAAEGAPIPGGSTPDSLREPILRVTLGWSPQEPLVLRTRVFPIDLLGSDALGGAVRVCPTFAPIDDQAFVCRLRPCDFNEDGLTDVRDLVRMVRCLNGADPCDPQQTARFDCDGDAAFDLDDVLCCALAILGEAPTPGAGEERAANLRLTMGLPAAVDGTVEIPMEIAGDQALGAARLVLALPTDRFSAIGVRVQPGTADLAVHEVDPGLVTVGLIRAGDALPPGAPLRFTLRLTPLPGTAPAGEVTLVNADFAAPDGARLVADPGEPIAVIGAVDRAILGAARPNPFHDAQRIPLVLPGPGTADLAVFDLGGRRVRTLHHGPLPAGVHTFEWDGRDENGARLPGGVYFYRAALDGTATARRVVMLAEPR